MQLVLDAAVENAWHREWMSNSPGSYEWWYTDIVSDDSEWTAVIIFLLGNPFSRYYRLSATGSSSDPLQYNAVFFALHRGSRLHHYLFASYPPTAVVSENAPFLLTVGPNELSFDGSGLQLKVDEENANRRTLTARVVVRQQALQTTVSPNRDPAERHWWLPSISAGPASVDLSIASAGVTNDIERIRFTGSGYHDHNWGILPFDRTVHSWTWARADFGGGQSAIVYSTNDGKRGAVTMLLLFGPDGSTSINARSEMRVSRWRLTRFGARYPQRFTVSAADASVEFEAQAELESVPFYVRFRLTAATVVGGSQNEGVGVGEFFKPGTMGSAVTAAAMERRIYYPFDGV